MFIFKCCTWMSKELPVSSKKWYKKHERENLETLKSSLQEYITVSYLKQLIKTFLSLFAIDDG